ncbi:methyltransferase domain-containing protein [Dyella sp. KRB-257]|uniref:methyltransferase domain-containing protein n=1 Tax=Dyella sp. KRB-257 TaxID=3400915 RepID=UPI003C0F47ED
MSSEAEVLKSMYEARFDKNAQASKNEIWKVLCRNYFQKYVKSTDTVVDIGAGYCEFINNIQCADKIAVDLNPDVSTRANAGIRVINESCTQLSSIPSGSVDCVFMSNFLEHLPSKELVLNTLRESRRILRPGGRVMILQPNIRYLPGEYWDYFDHHTALTDRSLAEALGLAGFDVPVCIPRFLPYTTKSRLPQSPWLVALYLRLPMFWRYIGKQAFLVGTVPA